MKIFIALLLFSLSFLNVTGDEKGDKPELNSKKAETVYFTGKVTDKLTGETLVGATVKIEGTNQKTLTDFDGKFVFEDVKPGTYNVSVQYISYQKNEIKNRSIDMLNSNLELQLNPVN